MYRLADFLDKYDTVIFDMDGVITSEQNYWNSAALTVWEYLNWNRQKQINATECMQNLKEIRRKVFCNDEIISELKKRGVNSNWDLGYVTVCIAWICGVENDDFSLVLDYVKKLPENIINEYDNIALECSKKSGFDFEWLKRNNLMWQTMHRLFQEWFLGDEIIRKQTGVLPMNSGKSGLLFKEEPIFDKAKLSELLKLLSKEKRVCTGTGRPYIEMIEPLKEWGVLKYFAADGLCNYNHVENAEKTLNNNALTKPHPYMFLKALYGTDYDDRKLIDGDYDKSKIEKTLVIGDAGADILAAQAMGADFCAVLTGINGKSAREFFESLNATYILDSCENLIIKED